MKAVVQDRYGPPGDVLRLLDVAEPEPAGDEVLVRVRAASIQPDIWHAVTGRPYILRLMGSGLRRPENPIPGMDLAGVVEAVGEGVTRLWPGDEVFGASQTKLWWKNGGTFAEYAAVPEEVLALKPEGVSFEQAAAVVTSGIIALINLRGDWVEPGQRVLINGAGGGVGSVAVQLAKTRGAHVTGVDCGEKLERIRTLGADRVIDYTREDVTRGAERYDFILDVASTLSLAACRRVLGPAGVYLIIGHDHFGRGAGRVLGSVPRMIGLMVLGLFSRHLPKSDLPMPTNEQSVAVLRELLAAGKLTPVVDRAFPLSQVREALRHLAEGKPRGSVVITP